MIVWQKLEQSTQQPTRSERIAFLVICNLCVAAALLVFFFPKFAESIWR